MLVAANLVLGGCAATVQPSQRYVAQAQMVNFPAVGLEAEAEIGQTLVSKANVLRTPAIMIENDVSELISQSLTNNRWSGTIIIPRGKLIKDSENADGTFYKSRGAARYATAAGNLPMPVGVFVPNDSRAPAVSFVFHTAIGATGYEFGKTAVAYTKTVDEAWSKDSFKSELIYGGLSQKTISISYREFSDGTARPAFSQELKYDLNDSDMIGFRGARFQVIKATNTSIRYKMIKPLD